MRCSQTRTVPALGSDWARRWEQLQTFIPWVLLVPPAVISLARPDQSGADRLVTLGLVVAAAAWVYLLHTRRSPEERHRRTASRLAYFAVLLVLFVALMSRDDVFVLFTISGFFHAYELKPWPLGVTGVFGTSVVLNTMTMGLPDGGAREIGMYVGVITVQTAAIGAGIVFSEKGMEEDRRRAEMVEKLEAALEENAGLHAQLLTQAREAGVLDERQRIAREIHDTLAQNLTGVVTQVQAAQRVWHSPEQARPHLDKALGLARDGLAEARRSVQALRPSQLDGAQLPDALSDMTRHWSEDADVGVRIDVTGDPVPLSPAIEVVLFRVAQEALTNVGKHAGASRVGVTLSYLGDMVLLDVRDDGRGMHNGNGRGFGLNSMRQRARSVGGTVDIESTPGEGTVVCASVPAITAEAK